MYPEPGQLFSHPLARLLFFIFFSNLLIVGLPAHVVRLKQWNFTINWNCMLALKTAIHKRIFTMLVTSEEVTFPSHQILHYCCFGTQFSILWEQADVCLIFVSQMSPYNCGSINQCFSSLNFFSFKMSPKRLFKWFLEVWSQTVKDKKAFKQKLQDYILNSL